MQPLHNNNNISIPLGTIKSIAKGIRFNREIGFQYLLVRLKEKTCSLFFKVKRISIPLGTIKRHKTLSRKLVIAISIPLGTIKSL